MRAGVDQMPPTPGSLDHRALGDQGAYGPAYLQSAYNAPSATKGAGQTVAIVDAFASTTVASDLAGYRSSFGLPPCTTASGCFRLVDEHGGTQYPPPNAAWSQEISIDVDMVSALCPLCHILLVESASASLADLGTGVNTAVAMGANVVTNSWGGAEYPTETADNAAYFNHPGVPLIASSGDTGYGVEFPAASGNVIAVGGTSLIQNSNTGTRNGSETAWSGSGSGCSVYMAKPSWQHDPSCPTRTEDDVSAVADPSTGVWVYLAGSWRIFGGTSVAAPLIGSMYALAGNPINPKSQPASFPYLDPRGLNDVVLGSDGACSGSYLCTAGPGYDGPTGLGTPNTAAAFSATPPPPPPPTTTTTVPPTTTTTTVPPTTTTTTTTTVPRTTTTTTPVPPTTTTTTTPVPRTTTTTVPRTTTTTTTTVPRTTTTTTPVPPTTAPTTLGPPLHLVATPALSRGVVLTWSSPTSNGGSAILGYRIYRGLSSGTETLMTAVICSAATCTYSDTATMKTSYFYEVAAFTAKGVGPLSNQASTLAT